MKGKNQYMWKKFLLPLFEEDKLVKGYEREQHLRRLYYITLIAMAALLIMSVLNAIGHSYPMMLSTLLAIILLAICLLIGWRKKSSEFLETVFLILFMILFPIYIVNGANEGFAILWLTIIPIVFMLMIDLKKGFIFSTYIVLFIFIIFLTPVHVFLQYDYGEDMRLRFPVMLLLSMQTVRRRHSLTICPTIFVLL